jgi:peroxiredoxin
VTDIVEAKLAVGALAPDFTAPDEKGERYQLSNALRVAPQVLVFYRGDW